MFNSCIFTGPQLIKVQTKAMYYLNTKSTSGKKLKASLKFQKHRKYQSLVFIPFRFVNYKQNSYKISRKRGKNQYSKKGRKLKILR